MSSRGSFTPIIVGDGAEDVGSAWSILTKRWKEPMMVFSIIGDSESFVSCPWPTATFQTAIMDAAKNAGGTLFLKLMKE